MPTFSLSKGAGHLSHNNREISKQTRKNTWDPQLSQYNIVYVDRPLNKVYDELFGDALDRYNAKQKRADRKIKNYLDKIERSKQEKPFYEIVVGISGIDQTPRWSEEEEIHVQCLDEYMRSWEQRNPNLKLVQAIMHRDEKGAPHLHIDFVPVSHGNRRGLETKNSFKGAMAEQGFVSQAEETDPKGRTRTRSVADFGKWRESEVAAMDQIMKDHGLELEEGDGRQIHYHHDVYKEIHDDLVMVQKKNQALTERAYKAKAYEEKLDSREDALRGRELAVETEKSNSKKLMDYAGQMLQKAEKQLQEEFEKRDEVRAQISDLKDRLTQLKRTKSELEASNAHLEARRASLEEGMANPLAKTLFEAQEASEAAHSLLGEFEEMDRGASAAEYGDPGDDLIEPLAEWTKQSVPVTIKRTLKGTMVQMPIDQWEKLMDSHNRLTGFCRDVVSTLSKRLDPLTQLLKKMPTKIPVTLKLTELMKKLAVAEQIQGRERFAEIHRAAFRRSREMTQEAREGKRVDRPSVSPKEADKPKKSKKSRSWGRDR